MYGLYKTIYEHEKCGGEDEGICHAHINTLQTMGLIKKYSNYGWRVLNNHLNEVHTKHLKKEYLYPGLDQYELYDELIDLPEEELKKVTKDQLQYPWVLRNVIKNRI